jgi:hypothetical protein
MRALDVHVNPFLEWNPPPWILLNLATTKIQGGNDVQARSRDVALIHAGICPRQ